MSDLSTKLKMANLAEYMENSGDEPSRVFTGEIVGVSFYDSEKNEPRKTPRLYVDMDADIPVGHCRVYAVEVNTAKGTQE